MENITYSISTIILVQTRSIQRSPYDIVYDATLTNITVSTGTLYWATTLLINASFFQLEPPCLLVKIWQPRYCSIYSNDSLSTEGVTVESFSSSIKGVALCSETLCW